MLTKGRKSFSQTGIHGENSIVYVQKEKRSDTNMAKEHQKRVLAALMAASIAIPTPVLAASPADFSDFPNNWATNALSYAVSNGLLSGDSERFVPMTH